MHELPLDNNHATSAWQRQKDVPPCPYLDLLERARALTAEVRALTAEMKAQTERIEEAAQSATDDDVIDPSLAEPREGEGRSMLTCSTCGSMTWSVVSWNGKGREQGAWAVARLRCLLCHQIVELTDSDAM